MSGSLCTIAYTQFDLKSETHHTNEYVVRERDFGPTGTARTLRKIDRMAYIGPRLRELQIIPYIDHTYA